MKERRYDNRKARIEKKFSTEAMRLLMALMPRQYPANAFDLEWGYGSDEWVVTTVDYWGEADSYDAFFLLHRVLINQTTDWEGIARAHDAATEEFPHVDESPYYSPWRMGGEITRSVIIRHCRQLVKAGVRWEAV